MMSTTSLSALDLRLKLLANGYECVPVIGKAPTALNAWESVNITPGLIAEWNASHGDNTGIRTGYVIGVDNDVRDPTTAALIEFEALHCGLLPAGCLKRVGMAPKTLFLCRLDHQNGMGKISGPEYVLKKEKAQIEILATGQQFVAYGVHPKTGKSYTWTTDSHPFNTPVTDLPVVTEAQLRAFVARCKEIIEEAGGVRDPGSKTMQSTIGSGTGKCATALAPLSAKDVIDLLNEMPNPEHVDRDQYVKIMLAAKGCIDGLGATGQLRDGDADAIGDAACHWAARWEAGDGDLGAEQAKWQSDWSRRDKPLSGWRHLLILAEKLGVEGIDKFKAVDFVALDPPEATVPMPDSTQRLLDAALKDPWDIDVSGWRIDKFTTGPAPEQPFLLKPFFTMGKAGIIFGPGGVGKGMVVLDLALEVAKRAVGRETTALRTVLSGIIPPEAAGAVIYLTMEDDKDDVHRRMEALDPTGERFGLPLYVFCLTDLPKIDPILVAEVDRTVLLTEFAKKGLDALADKVEKDSGYPVKLFAMDPAGDLVGDEDLAKFVKPLMRHMCTFSARRKCTTILIGHTAKNLDLNKPSMRGSGAWEFNGRFAMALTPPLHTADERKKIPASVIRNTVWGMLVKGNHKGAPVLEKLVFLRDATGRLVKEGQSGGGAEFTAPAPTTSTTTGNDKCLDLLVETCIAAAKAGRPFSRTKDNGLYKRREELPDSLTTLPRARLEELANQAINEQRLARDEDGKLIAPPMDRSRLDRLLMSEAVH